MCVGWEKNFSIAHHIRLHSFSAIDYVHSWRLWCLPRKKSNKILESESGKRVCTNTSNQKNAPGPYLNFRNKHERI